MKYEHHNCMLNVFFLFCLKGKCIKCLFRWRDVESYVNPLKKYDDLCIHKMINFGLDEDLYLLAFYDIFFSDINRMMLEV